jgi:hypothetical protein
MAHFLAQAGLADGRPHARLKGVIIDSRRALIIAVILGRRRGGVA